MTTAVVDLGDGRVVAAHETPPSLQLVYDPVAGTWHTADSTGGKAHGIQYLWNTSTLQFEVATVPVAGSGGTVSVDNFPATQAVSGTFWQATQPVSIAAAISVSNMVAQGLTDAQLRASAVPVSFAASANPTATGALTVSGQAVTLALLESKSVGIIILGTWTGTISLEASANGTDWASYEFYNPITSVELAFSSTTVNGFYQLVNSNGITHVRARASAAMTGSASVSITGTQTTNKIDLDIKEHGTAIPSYGTMCAGSDGTLLKYLRVASDGTLRIDPTGTTPQPVTGTFFQATQPVSIAAAVALDAGSLAALETTELGAATLAALETISVANFPATQPVSGTVELGATSLAALETVSVLGTFWQATQPVSGPLTDTQLRATPVPVSGTFFQATQPVSQPAATDWRTDQRRGLTPQFAVINAAGAGDNVLVAAQVGLKIKVLQYTLVSEGTVAITFRNGVTPITGAMPLVVNSGAVSPYVPAAAGHLFETAVNTALNLNLSAAIGVRGHLTYILEA